MQQIIDGRIVRDLAGHRDIVTPDPNRHTRCSTTQTPRATTSAAAAIRAARSTDNPATYSSSLA